MESQAPNPTFDDLVALEPRLGELRHIAETAGDNLRREDGGFCANAVWYGYPRRGGPYGEGAIRTEVISLVGHESHHPDPIMRTSGAYDLVTQTLWDLLPACDHGDTPCGWGPSVPDVRELAVGLDAMHERLQTLEESMRELVDAMKSTIMGDPRLSTAGAESSSFISPRIIAATEKIQRNLRRGN